MNELKHMAEFRSVLENYKPSDELQKILRGLKVALLLAPSAGGRNTIINKLVETGDYHFFLSDTTREPRINNGILEQNGREYWFRTEEEFLDELHKGEYLEAEVLFYQQVSGISIRELKKARAMHKIAINDVDINGIANAIKAKPDTAVAIILPPSFEEWLQRVNSRGPMDPAERTRRFETAAQIYKLAADGTYPIIINDQLDEAVSRVDHLARFGLLDQNQQPARQLAEQLYRDTQKFLKKLA